MSPALDEEQVAMSSVPEPASNDTLELYVELPEREIHLLDTIVSGYDGIAQVRRDWICHQGRRYCKVLVPPGFLEETRQVLEWARGHLAIGEIRLSPPGDPCASPLAA